MSGVPSVAAQVLLAVIPIVGIAMGGAVIILYVIFSYKTKRALIDKGMYKRIEFDIDMFSLFGGMVLLPIGFSLMIFFLVKQGFSYGMLSGLIPFSVGLSLILFFVIRMRVLSKRNG